jgi:hypothetical protein
MLHVVSWLLFVAGFVAVLWPLPLFALPASLVGHYVAILDAVFGTDRTSRGALPWVWMFYSLPAAVVLWFAGLCCRWLGESA